MYATDNDVIIFFFHSLDASDALEVRLSQMVLVASNPFDFYVSKQTDVNKVVKMHVASWGHALQQCIQYICSQRTTFGALRFSCISCIFLYFLYFLVSSIHVQMIVVKPRGRG